MQSNAVSGASCRASHSTPLISAVRLPSLVSAARRMGAASAIRFSANRSSAASHSDAGWHSYERERTGHQMRGWEKSEAEEGGHEDRHGERQ